MKVQQFEGGLWLVGNWYMHKASDGSVCLSSNYGWGAFTTYNVRWNGNRFIVSWCGKGVSLPNYARDAAKDIILRGTPVLATIRQQLQEMRNEAI